MLILHTHTHTKKKSGGRRGTPISVESQQLFFFLLRRYNLKM